MTNDQVPEAVDTVVIGAGQSGLAAGHHLAQRAVDVVSLDANEQVGAACRNHRDSLRLFTPSHHSSLPEMAFPSGGSPSPCSIDDAEVIGAWASSTTSQQPARRTSARNGWRRIEP
jgi:putative flavoprotein involved in K+ transport